MRIGINGMEYLPGKLGGVETGFLNLLYNLQRLSAEDVEFTLFTNPVGFSKVHLDKNVFKSVELPWQQSKLSQIYYRTILEITGTDLRARMIDKEQLDLVHCPFTRIIPQGIRSRLILTYWDAQQEYFPQNFTAAALKQRKKSHGPSCHRADHIISPSEHTKKTIIEKFGVPAHKISVIPQAYDERFSEELNDETISSYRKKYDADFDYIFYPAATWPHKNHRVLIEAFRIFREKEKNNLKLLFLGIKTAEFSELSSLIEKYKLGDSVRYVGYVPYTETDIIAFFKGAMFMVFPSKFEGFGFPVLEAMAAGVPVICSDLTSLPEVGGDAVMYFDGNDPEVLAEKIKSLYEDKNLRDELSLKGKRRARGFSWARTTEETFQLYKKVLGA